MTQKILLLLIFSLLLIYPTSSQAAGSLPVTGPKQPVVIKQIIQPRVKELPKTGLPLISFLLVGLIPIGYKLRDFGQDLDDKNPSAQDIWSLRHHPH